MRFLVLLSLTLVACADPDFAAPIAPLSCGERAAAGPVAELDSLATAGVSMTMGPCGDLTYVTPDGDVMRVGPALDAPVRVAEAGAGATFSTRGDQVMMRDTEGGVTWRRLPDGPEVRVEAGVQGFARSGDEEIAWVCGGGEIGTIDEDGYRRLVGDVATCAGAVVARAAPVLLYVAPEDLLRRVRLDTGDAVDLPEVPFIAVRGDQLTLSRDGRVLIHRPVRSSQHVGIFDLGAPEGERFLAAPELRSHAVLEAERANHVFGVDAADGALVLTRERWLNFYEGAQLLALSPDGSRALLTSVSEDGLRRTYEVSDLDTLESEPLEAPVTGNLRLAGRSRDGDTLALSERNVVGVTTLYRFRWDAPGFEAVPAVGRNAQVYWVGGDGSLLVHANEEEAALLDPDGEERARWSNVGRVDAQSTARGLLMTIRSRDWATQRILAVRPDGTQEALYAGQSVQRLILDRDGERVAFSVFEQDVMDPSMFQTRIFAGAVP